MLSQAIDHIRDRSNQQYNFIRRSRHIIFPLIYTSIYTIPLCLENPSRVLVSQELSIRISNVTHQRTQSLRLSHCFFLGIFTSQHLPQDGDDYNVGHQVAQRKTVPKVIPRTALGTVELRPDDGAAVANRDLHGVGNAAFRLSRDIVCRPRQHDRNSRVDTCCGEDSAEIGNAGPVIGEQDDVSNTSESGSAHDERCSSTCSLRKDGDGDGQHGCNSIGRNREQLGFCGRVPKLFDDGWLVSG